MFAVTYIPEDLLIGTASSDEQVDQIIVEHAVDRYREQREATDQLVDARNNDTEWVNEISAWIRGKYKIERLG